MNLPNRYWSNSELKFNKRQTMVDLDRLIHPRIEHLSGFHKEITLLCK